MQNLHPISFRADENLYKKMQRWLKKNPVMTQSQMISLAIEKFITEPQTLEPVFASEEEENKMIKKMMKEHKHTLDKLR